MQSRNHQEMQLKEKRLRLIVETLNNKIKILIQNLEKQDPQKKNLQYVRNILLRHLITVLHDLILLLYDLIIIRNYVILKELKSKININIKKGKGKRGA